jgi:hypothetical protein
MVLSRATRTEFDRLVVTMSLAKMKLPVTGS